MNGEVKNFEAEPREREGDDVLNGDVRVFNGEPLDRGNDRAGEPLERAGEPLAWLDLDMVNLESEGAFDLEPFESPSDIEAAIDLEAAVDLDGDPFALDAADAEDGRDIPADFFGEPSGEELIATIDADRELVNPGLDAGPDPFTRCSGDCGLPSADSSTFFRSVLAIFIQKYVMEIVYHRIFIIFCW